MGWGGGGGCNHSQGLTIAPHYPQAFQHGGHVILHFFWQFQKK
jgi:hypothetical protein